MINYHKMCLEEIAKCDKQDVKPKLLLHTCCAPCSSHTLRVLKDHFDITICYYNPNIYPESEFDKRYNEQVRFVKEFGLNVEVLDKDYDPSLYFEAVKGLEHLGERSARCSACFRLRLDYVAKMAKEKGFDYFTTSLTISPMKNGQDINEIMGEVSEKYGIKCLYSDFKKENGYKDSIDLSHEYHLYRQDYCGCVFSKKEREDWKKQKALMEENKLNNEIMND